jgi:hypothetical protein
MRYVHPRQQYINEAMAKFEKTRLAIDKQFDERELMASTSPPASSEAISRPRLDLIVHSTELGCASIAQIPMRNLYAPFQPPLSECRYEVFTVK